ncbi:MAG: response regulator, partial [Flavobacteriaceae bacterium]|nr:response regulator [Flavobacteriaceae bacterium]
MKHILLIEDDKNLLNMLDLLIQRNTGIDVVTAENGIEAKTLLNDRAWDLIITDINLPDCSGLELVELIRVKHENAKIIMITGNDDSNLAIKALNLQVDAYLLKPFDIEEFINAINKLTSKDENTTALKKSFTTDASQRGNSNYKTPDDHPCEVLRQCALEDLKILDSESNVRFDRFTKLAASVFNVPISTISLIDNNRQWFLSKQGLDICETSRDISFCGHAIHEKDI